LNSDQSCDGNTEKEDTFVTLVKILVVAVVEHAVDLPKEEDTSQAEEDVNSNMDHFHKACVLHETWNGMFAPVVWKMVPEVAMMVRVAYL
jgi:hypothetical protein